MRWAFLVFLLCVATWAANQLRRPGAHKPDTMLGGFSKLNPAANDAGVEQARSAVAAKLSAKLGSQVKVEVLEVHSQVVAGTNYRLKVKAHDAKLGAKFYEAQVWAKLPAHGGDFEVTHLDEISADKAGAASKEDEPPLDMDVEDAAAYAVQQLSQQSNSLFPFQLKEILSAQRVPGSNGDGGVTHTLRLRLSQGAQKDEIFEVEVGMDEHGHRLKSSRIVLSG